MIFVGGGAVISGASEELKKFVKKVDAPVCDTLMGKGAFDGTDDHYTGMLGMHGTKASNFGVTECDLVDCAWCAILRPCIQVMQRNLHINAKIVTY